MTCGFSWCRDNQPDAIYSARNAGAGRLPARVSDVRRIPPTHIHAACRGGQLHVLQAHSSGQHQTCARDVIRRRRHLRLGKCSHARLWKLRQQIGDLRRWHRSDYVRNEPSDRRGDIRASSVRLDSFHIEGLHGRETRWWSGDDWTVVEASPRWLLRRRQRRRRFGAVDGIRWHFENPVWHFDWLNHDRLLSDKNCRIFPWNCPLDLLRWPHLLNVRYWMLCYNIIMLPSRFSWYQG